MTSHQLTSDASIDVRVRPLRESDLATADHIMRLAFGTFLGLPEPTAFMGDAGYVRTRWRADPAAAFAAEVGGELVGSNLATNRVPLRTRGLVQVRATSSSGRSVQVRLLSRCSSDYWMPPKSSPLDAGCFGWWLELTPVAMRPIAKCWRVGSARTFRVLRCIGRTTLVTIVPVFL